MDIDAQIKVLEMAIAAIRLAARSRNIEERYAAVSLEREFVNRVEKLRAEQRTPSLALAHA